MPPRDDEPPEPEPDEGPVLAPEELEITEDEHVTEIDDGRFVVSPDERPTDDPVAADASPPGPPEPTPEPEQPPAFDQAAVHEWLADDVGDVSSRYGFDVTATFDGTVAQRRLFSNDVVTSFESLVLWYAQQIDSDTPVEEVLGILLLESNAPVRYPPRSIKQLVAATDLGPDDTIADLLAAVEAEDGVEL
jgi:hypothetical protein